MSAREISSITANDLWMGMRFFAQLPFFLRRRWNPTAARAELDRRLRWRAADFLVATKRWIYQNSQSPYRRLLAYAGCEFGDLAKLVETDGLEVALRILCHQGVYLTVEEFKGRRPVVRGGVSIEITPELLRNPGKLAHLKMQSGGSRSRGTAVSFDLDFIRDCALDSGLALHCRGGDGWQKATWEVPGGGALFSLLEFSQFGALPARWFSQLDPAENELHPRYRWSTRAFQWGARLAGARMPQPQFVALANALPIAQWMAATLKRAEVPYLLTYPSSALRVCQAALQAGIELAGAQLTIAGEPCSQTRIDFIRRTGATVLPKYGIMETGPVGYGCLSPAAPDDLHLLADLHAVIRPESGKTPENLRAGSVLFTSLRASAPLVLLNVSMGDQAELVQRHCGCPLEELGWRSHIHTIQSHEKLTCGGMNFIDSDVIKVLDEILPGRFGGSPTDFQILEEQSICGEPILKILVRPSLGPIDEYDVIDAFLQGVSRGEDARRVMGMAWKSGSFLRVERRDPVATPSGKILHVGVQRADTSGSK